MGVIKATAWKASKEETRHQFYQHVAEEFNRLARERTVLPLSVCFRDRVELNGEFREHGGYIEEQFRKAGWVAEIERCYDESYRSSQPYYVLHVKGIKFTTA